LATEITNFNVRKNNLKGEGNITHEHVKNNRDVRALLGKSNIKISFGARVVHIIFHQVDGEGNQYRGQWQGGRVSTGGKEVQI